MALVFDQPPMPSPQPEPLTTGQRLAVCRVLLLCLVSFSLGLLTQTVVMVLLCRHLLH